MPVTMRSLQVLMVYVLLQYGYTVECFAQDTAKIPTLPVWYEASGISKVSFLENFDVAHGGSTAIAINKNCGETWYLGNGNVDTNNKFCWGRGLWVAKADFNGDGIADYIDDNRNIFQGVQRDSPPQTKPVTTYQDFQMPVPGRQNRYFIDDFNNDGKEDIIVPGLYNLAKVLLGNSDVTKMQVVTLPNIKNTAYSLQYVVGAWKDTDGKNKIVLYQQTDTNYAIRTEAFFLYEFIINTDLSVEYTALDTTAFKDFKDRFTPTYFSDASIIWFNKNHTEYCLMAAYGKTDFYSITQNRFQYVQTKKIYEGSSIMLFGNISDTLENGFIRGINPYVFLYTGNPTIDTLIKAKIPIFYNSVPYESVAYIGDVNHDGYGDIACIYGEDNGKMVIYLGKDFTNEIFYENKNNQIRITNTQLISKHSICEIKIEVDEPMSINVSIFNLTGKLVTIVGDYDVQNSSVIPIEINKLNCNAGIYNLRCIIGKQVIDKALIITD